jgi:hypothetical protein
MLAQVEIPRPCTGSEGPLPEPRSPCWKVVKKRYAGITAIPLISTFTPRGRPFTA